MIWALEVEIQCFLFPPDCTGFLDFGKIVECSASYRHMVKIGK